MAEKNQNCQESSFMIPPSEILENERIRRETYRHLNRLLYAQIIPGKRIFISCNFHRYKGIYNPEVVKGKTKV